MHVLIVGAGHMGRAIAIRLAAGGNALTLFDIDPAKAEAIASELGGSGPAALELPWPRRRRRRCPK